MRNSFFVPFLNGEPFIFPRIWEWLEYMKDEEVPVHLYTNAEFMDVNRLVRYPNIRLVCCGLNAATEETYRKVMRGPKYETAKAKVEDLIKKARFKAGVWASMVIVEDNQHEVEMFKKMWGKNAIFGEFKNWGGARHDKLEKTSKRRFPCYSLFRGISILWDGRVALCCLDYNGQLILGDANKQTLTEIWRQSKWIRDRHRRLDFSMIPCRDCNQNI